MIYVDLAFPFARDYSGTNLTSVALLRERSSLFKYFIINEIILHVGVVENQDNALFNVFPNPNNGSFNVIIPENLIKSKIEIYSIVGQLILSKQLNAGNTFINLEKERGLFMYLIIDENDRVEAKGKIILN